MAWSNETINDVYDKTEGYCRYCNKKLSFQNYGTPGAFGCWEIDHSIPVSRGGTDHANNLYAACLACNREKSDMTGAEFLRFIGR